MPGPVVSGAVSVRQFSSKYLVFRQWLFWRVLRFSVHCHSSIFVDSTICECYILQLDCLFFIRSFEMQCVDCRSSVGGWVAYGRFWDHEFQVESTLNRPFNSASTDFTFYHANSKPSQTVPLNNFHFAESSHIDSRFQVLQDVPGSKNPQQIIDR
jgi:hypothetical protein